MVDSAGEFAASQPEEMLDGLVLPDREQRRIVGEGALDELVAISEEADAYRKTDRPYPPDNR